MNGSIFWRLFWKEYRVERAFWIAMVGLTLLLELLLIASTSFINDPRWVVGGSQRILFAFGFAVAFPAFYALGCGATAFASEHETGTFEFQRVLPVTAGRLFWSKIAMAAVSTLAMIAVLWPLAIAFSAGRLPTVGQAAGLWALWGFAAVELLVWGTLYSLLSTQPLKATILAVATASVVVHLTTSHYIRNGADYLGLEPYRAALPARIAIATAVGLIDVWLGMRWFREKVVTLGGEKADSRSRTATAGRADARTTISRTTGFGRLVWQTFRQSASTIGVFIAILMLVGLPAVCAQFLTRSDRFGPVARPDLIELSVFAVPVLVALMGASVFLADQRRQAFRFLAERGVSPRGVWWSRQLVWMAVVVLATVAATLVVAIATSRQVRPGGTAWEEIGYAIAVPPTIGAVCFAAGQLCSMIFRSGILAAVFGLVLAGLLAVWTGLMLIGGVPWLWSVAPIPVVLLVATRVRTPAWLRERGGLRGWLPMGLVLAVPTAAILTAVLLYRAYEIPVVSPGFSPQEYFRPPTAEEKATMDMYREASRLVVQNDPEAIQRAVDASRGPACDCFDPFNRNKVIVEMSRLGSLVLFSGDSFKESGKLDEALERYLAALRISVQLRERASQLGSADELEGRVQKQLLGWSTAPGQTPERVGRAVEAVGRITENLPSRTDPIKSQYYVLRQVINGDAEAMSREGMSEQRIVRTKLWFDWMPWERVRAQRLLNVLIIGQIDAMRDVESKMAKGLKVPTQFYTWNYDFNPAELGDYWLRRRFFWDANQATMNAVTKETRRRATRLLLAIEAWKLEHDRLPETLDELAGTYLDRIPLDPYSAKPFWWFPQGVATPTVLAVWPERTNEDIVPAQTPIVWSAGPRVQFGDLGGSLMEQALIRRTVSSEAPWERPTLELQIWQAGWAFPVP